MSDLMTRAQVARLLGVTTRTVDRWTRERGLPKVQPFDRGPVRFRRADVEQWLRAERAPQAA